MDHSLGCSMNRGKRAPVRVNPVMRHPQERRMSLNGQWNFRLDPKDAGLKERWFEDIGILREEIEVPGTWQGQGFGSDEEDTVWDFQFKTRVFRATYKGTGWYGRRFFLPGEWRGMRIWVNLGGVHPSAEVWLNGLRLGENHAPFVPFGFEVTDIVRFDSENLLVIRVHEQSRIMGLAYNWQGNWSGLYRGVELTATGEAYLDRFWIYADVDSEQMRIRSQIGGLEPGGVPVVLRVSVRYAGEEEPVASTQVQINRASEEFCLSIPSPKLWSPDTPNLYRVDAEFVCNGVVLDALSERTGFVKLSTEGKHFLINGEPYYIRGSGDFIANPETGCPDTDRQRWRKKLATLRQYGYNYVRCQSYVPTPEYFDVADEVGLLVQSEMGMLGAWGGHSIWHVYQWPQPTPEYRDALKWQWDHVVMRDVNHPSANIYCMSNELGGRTEHPRIAWQCYYDTKAIKPTALVIWTDGGYNEELPGDFVNAEADVDGRCSKPVIQHEFRWWSSLPDVRIMHKYSGAVRPYGAEIALEAAARHGISHLLPLAAANSQRLQFIEAKLKMENCRRDNPHLAGICHFNAMDANPSPQGIIDEFYDLKYVDSDTWLQTNGDTVILVSQGADDRVYSSGDEVSWEFYVSDFSHPPLERPVFEWELVAGNEAMKKGRITYSHQPYCTCRAGSADIVIPETPKPVAAKLRGTLYEGERVFRNQWDLWLFPKQVGLPAFLGIYGRPKFTWLKGLNNVRMVSPGEVREPRDIRALLTEQLDDTLIEFVRAGGRVILAVSEGLTRPFRPKLGLNVGRYFFTPPANYPPYEDGHDGTIITAHPMLGDIPHEGFADLLFVRMMGESAPIDIGSLGLEGIEPVIRVMHSYPVARPLAYLLECSLGRGGLILCSLDLEQSLPEARYLLSKICWYATGEDFRPASRLSEDALARILGGSQISK